ncbi:MAG: DUF2269 domain-containing protein [Burkholderiales bacterium]|nr:DUF2269 domain-containing protein [Burkholderiales bacterium]
MSDAYTLWKTAHAVGAAVVFGGGLGIAYFTWFGYRRAVRTDDLAALRALLRLTVIADACLTAPAVAFQFASGLVLMRALGWPWVSPWSMAVLGLYLLAGACWLPILALQVRLHRVAARSASVAALPGRFHRWFGWWFGLAIPAFAIVLVLFYLMVAKPLPVARA